MINKNVKPHGIMFHHFFNETHVKGQGAISAENLESIILYYGPNNFLPAKEFHSKALEGKLQDNDFCLTLDDALLCQYEIAKPIFDKYNLTAFWFIYTSVLNGEKELLEVYRKFRTEFFEDLDKFYDAFFEIINHLGYASLVQKKMIYYSHDNWSQYPFYSKNDTKFRYIRDSVLGLDNYKNAMAVLMKSKGVELDSFCRGLWMTSDHIKNLFESDHVIGLHSHTHPTNLKALSFKEQWYEYKTNYDQLTKITGKKPKVASHPCNSYNSDTLEIFRELSIDISFCSNMSNNSYSNYELPRMDHANIMSEIGK